MSFKRLVTHAALAATVWISAAAAAQAAPLFEPDANWTTLETAHFRIYYTDGFEPKARQVAAIAEDAHAKLVPFMQVEPGGLTEVIISDGYDELNSMAHNSPHRAIWLWQTPPNPDEGMYIGRYDQWMRLLFIHEYTHILQFEHTSQLANHANSALGGLIFSVFPQLPIDITINLPDLLTNAPAFFTEGLAVYTESTLTPGGRGVEGDFDMVRRMAFLENRVPDIDQVWGRFLLDWPMGGYEYTWGTPFIQHLVKTCGTDAPAKIMKAYGTLPWLGFEHAVERAVGVSVDKLWAGMREDLAKRYQEDLQAHQARQQMAANGGTPWIMPRPTDVTTSGRYHRHPVWGPDGTLYYTEALKNKRPQLLSVKDGGEPQFVMGKSTRSAPALSPDGKQIYFESDTEDTYKKLSSFRDLFVYDREAKKAKRLTHGARTFAPALSPDGTRLAAVTSGGAKAGLAIFDTAGKQLRKWTFDNNDYQFGNPAWSPDGRQLAVAVWQGGDRDVFLVDADTGAMERLWADKAVDFYPTWTPDGAQLVFTSDRTGIFNLYAYHLGTRKLTQLTDVLGGAFDPAVSPDGKTVAYANYTGRGYDIQTIPFEPARSGRVAELPKGFSLPEASTANVPVEPVRIGGYNPLQTLTPSTWFPILGQDEWGQNVTIYSFWQDVLRQHNLTLFGGYGFFSQRLNYGFRYLNNQGPFQWAVSMNEYPNAGRFPLSETQWANVWQWNKTGSFVASFPGLRNPMFDPPPISGDNWNLGVRTEMVKDYALAPDEAKDAAGKPVVVPLNDHAQFATVMNQGMANSVFVEWQRANGLKFPYDYGPTQGQLTSIGAEQAVPVLGADQTFTRFWADHRFYQPVPWAEKHSLAVRTTAGALYNRNGDFFYSLWRAPFGYQPVSTINRWDLTTLTNFDNRYVMLRGYPFLLGNRNVSFNMEYRFPIAEVMRGWGGAPIFLNRWYGVGFIDNGLFWGLESNKLELPTLADFKSGVGFELRAQTTMFQAVPIDVRGGVAYGLMAGGALQYNMGLGTTF